MRNRKLTILAGIALTCLFVLGINIVASAQGRGRGGGAPAGGQGRGTGQPSGVGVDRGLGTASGRSGGRSDQGLGNASDRSNGRSDDGLARARANSLRADQELRDHPGLAEHLGINPNDLRTQYQAALANNPNLKFGQFVAANVVARSLGATNSNITTAAILNGLADGNSIGRTLQDLGLNSDAAKEAEKQAKR